MGPLFLHLIMAANPTVSDYRAIARGFPTFNTREVNDFIRQFQLFDTSGDGSIDTDELRQMMDNLGMDVDDALLLEIIAEVDADNSGTIEFAEFLQLMSNVKAGTGSKMAAIVTKAGDMYKVTGATDASQHSFSEEEKVSFSDYINTSLGSDSDLQHVLPLDPEAMDIFHATKDGILLCKLINEAVPNTIDERAINTKKLNAFKEAENLNLAINSAKAIGCNVVNVGHDDPTSGKQHIILGLVWQIIRIGLLNSINLQNHPELYRLLEDGETMEDFLKLPPDQILLRWVNYHLAAANHPKRINNFGKDVKDSEAFTVLLHQLNRDCTMDALNESDNVDRAEIMLQQADKLGCRKFVTPRDVAAPNSKLNFAFVANLFNTCPGLAELTEEELADLDLSMFDSEGDREARAFALWINCLGIEPFVRDLFEDLRDGLVLLRKQMKFSLVGIAGSDINDGNRTLTLAIVWQLMREHLLRILTRLGGGQKVKDADLIAWANDKVTGSGKSTSMNDFRDSSLSNSLFFLDLIDAIRPGTVEAEYVTAGGSDEEKLDNARYAVALARRIGALIFLLPEDIVDVKPKLILTLVATLMALDRGN